MYAVPVNICLNMGTIVKRRKTGDAWTVNQEYKTRTDSAVGKDTNQQPNFNNINNPSTTFPQFESIHPNSIHHVHQNRHHRHSRDRRRRRPYLLDLDVEGQELHSRCQCSRNPLRLQRDRTRGPRCQRTRFRRHWLLRRRHQWRIRPLRYRWNRCAGDCRFSAFWQYHIRAVLLHLVSSQLCFECA
jgi:hypothetical protein